MAAHTDSIAAAGSRDDGKSFFEHQLECAMTDPPAFGGAYDLVHIAPVEPAERASLGAVIERLGEAVARSNSVADVDLDVEDPMLGSHIVEVRGAQCLNGRWHLMAAEATKVEHAVVSQNCEQVLFAPVIQGARVPKRE